MQPQRTSRAPRGSLAEAYRQGRASAFFPLCFAQREDRLRAVRDAAARPIAAEVLAGLRRQNEGLAPSPARERHLEALGRGAVAVVTGQQVGLFLGPLFTIYKAATAIRFARLLTEESGTPAVPIFWLQTEDHDLPEIARFWLPDPQGRPTGIELPHDGDNRRSVAHLRFGPEIAGAVDELGELLRERPHADEHLRAIARHYREGASWAEAFAGLLAELFAEEGLVVVDPRTDDFAHVAREVHRRALEDAEGISEALLARVRALEAAGFGAAVHVRPGAPLSFFHPEGREGPRHRLERVGDDFAEVGGGRRFGKRDLLARLEDDPLCFSTSALLRPLLQDHLLPTAAYVGGPGELAYFAQLAPMYARFGRPMPLFVPRAHLRILDRRIVRRLERLRLSEEDLGWSEEELVAHLRRGEAPSAVELSHELLAPFVETLERRAPALLQLEPGLERALRRTRASVERAVSRFSSKVARAHLRKDGRLVEDLRTVKDALLPLGIPQERCHGLAPYAARWGARAFVRAVIDNVSPLDPTFRSLRYEDIERA